MKPITLDLARDPVQGHGPPFEHHEPVTQPERKVKELLHEDDGHVAAFPQNADHFADLLDAACTVSDIFER